MQLQFVEMDEGGQLRMRWYPYRPRSDDDDEPEAEETVLLDQVSDVQWRYFGFDEGAEALGEDPEWYEEWENPQQRPQLMHLSLKFRGEPLPDLMVAVPN